MNTSKLTARKDFKAEVTTIKRTQANIGLLSMDLDAFSKGKAKGAKNAREKGKGKGQDNKGKGKKGACYNCGSPDHAEPVSQRKGKMRKSERKRQRWQRKGPMSQMLGVWPLRGQLPY
eukprot:2007014-Amphidinium_carterae.1